ncbi:putative ABC transport system substrate-binding protein [Rhizobiales bacterium GAS113]|nr:putative ABC transport system substrate-binding protein [Rhizobiales bacterium GAS113]
MAASAHADTALRQVVCLIGGVSLADEAAQSRIAEFKAALTKLGWAEGRNMSIVIKSSEGDPEKRRQLAKELVALKPDVIVTSSTFETAAVARETKTIPAVFSTATDPVASGFVQSLARPGGNITGFSTNGPAMAGKWLQLLLEAAPGRHPIGVMFNPETAPGAGAWYMAELKAPASEAEVEIVPLPVTAPEEIEGAIARFATSSSPGLILIPDSFTVTHRARIIAAVNAHRIPAISPYRYFVTAGWLMSYGGALEEPGKQVAIYVDLILRGANVAELPVQTTRKFELAINARTADALQLTLPAALLARADQIIQ